MAKGALSATMVSCIDLARDHGGELVRYQGGFWANREGGHPLVNRREYFAAGTVNAIVDRGYAEYTEWKEGRQRFPIAFKLTEKATQNV